MLDITQSWYGRSLVVLRPLSWLFGRITALRRWLYRVGFFKTIHFNVPVIVVGNITVGGTGKTPLVIWLAQLLRAHGYSPGIVSRGYGGLSHRRSYLVSVNSPVEEAGDEALLLARHTSCPVLLNKNRAAAVKDLLEQVSCDIVIADDGLQHYQLGRAMEIAVVDGSRRFGNQYLLPAGPLREPIERLKFVDFVIINGHSDKHEIAMKLIPTVFVSLKNNEQKNFSEFTRQTIHAVAGIGNPQRFFDSLKEAGFEVIPHAFPDHHHFEAKDLEFADHYPIIMTEKDAVKCRPFASDRCWYIAVMAKIDEAFTKQLLIKLQSSEVRNEPKNDFEKNANGSGYPVQRSDIRK